MSREGNKMKLMFDKDGNLTEKISSENDSSVNFQAEQTKLLKGVTNLKVGSGKNSIPLGESVLGGAGATIVSEIIQGIIPSNLTGMPSTIIRLIGSIFALNLMTPILGQASTSAGKLFVTYEAVRDLLPIDSLIGNLGGSLKMGNSFGAENPPVPASAVSGTNPQAELDAWQNS